MAFRIAGCKPAFHANQMLTVITLHALVPSRSKNTLPTVVSGSSKQKSLEQFYHILYRNVLIGNNIIVTIMARWYARSGSDVK